jgi:hypothetical protein
VLRSIGPARGGAEYEIAESTAADLVGAGHTMITRTGHRQAVPPAVPDPGTAKGYFRHGSTPVMHWQAQARPGVTRPSLPGLRTCAMRPG